VCPGQLDASLALQLVPGHDKSLKRLQRAEALLEGPKPTTGSAQAQGGGIAEPSSGAPSGGGAESKAPGARAEDKAAPQGKGKGARAQGAAPAAQPKPKPKAQAGGKSKATEGKRAGPAPPSHLQVDQIRGPVVMQVVTH
jgi:hypothetical protein